MEAGMTGWQAESARRLRHVMRVKGETVRTLAAKSGVSDRAIRSWANGKSMPNAYSARAVCEALGVSMDWLFAREARR